MSSKKEPRDLRDLCMYAKPEITIQIIRIAAKEGNDISPALPVLWNILQEKIPASPFIVAHAVSALVLHYLNQKDFEKLGDLRWKKGARISNLIFNALNGQSFYGRDILGLLDSIYFLGIDGGFHQSGAWEKPAWRFREFVRNERYIVSLAGIQQIEKMLLASYKKWQTSQGNARTTEALHLQLQEKNGMAGLLQCIAERKAQRTKEKDGALLAGETIERPKKGKGIFRTTLQRA